MTCFPPVIADKIIAGRDLTAGVLSSFPFSHTVPKTLGVPWTGPTSCQKGRSCCCPNSPVPQCGLSRTRAWGDPWVLTCDVQLGSTEHGQTDVCGTYLLALLKKYNTLRLLVMYVCHNKSNHRMWSKWARFSYYTQTHTRIHRMPL